jgi:hypothetical protein
MKDGETDLDAALAELATALRKKHKPSRFHARAILVALGEQILAEDGARVTAGVQRVAELVRERPADWEAAVREELELASTEFVRSVDPRFLTHPRYDFAYTVAVRERLEARLAAAERMGIAPAEGLLEQIVEADELLAPYLSRLDERKQRGGKDRTAGE